MNSEVIISCKIILNGTRMNNELTDWYNSHEQTHSTQVTSRDAPIQRHILLRMSNG